MRVPIAFLALSVVGAAAAPSGKAVLVAGEGLNEPFGVCFDAAGNTYVVEMGGNRVSLLGRDGRPGVLAGTGEKGLDGDGGPAAKARFNGPHHLLPGPDGGLYACDLDNRRVRAIDLKTGVVRTVAGNGAKGVPRDGEDARAQPLVDPRAIAFDSKGNLYICERGGHALRVVDPGGKIRTVAGTGEAGFSGDGGPALRARLNGPKHVSVDRGDDVLITDTENHVVRVYSPKDATIRRVAGTGEVYIADSENHRVIRIER